MTSSHESGSRDGRNWIAHEDWLAAVPVVHGRAVFAAAVREACREFAPDVIAVELPPALIDLVSAGIARLPSPSVIRFQSGEMVEAADGSGSEMDLCYVPIDPADAIIEAVRLGQELGLTIEPVDLFTSEREPAAPALPDPDLVAAVGVRQYHESVRPLISRARSRTDVERGRELTMAWRVGALRELGRVLLVVGLAHWEGIRRALESPQAPPDDDDEPMTPMLCHLHAESVHGLFGELPFVAAHYERWRRRASREANPTPWQPERAIELMVSRSEEEYERQWGEEVPRPARRALRRFASRLAVTGGSVMPDLYDLVVAAKGCKDDDLACVVYDKATSWPWGENQEPLEVVQLDLEQLRQNWRKVHMLRRDPRVFGARRDPTEVFRRRQQEGEDEDWERDWDEGYQGGCSYVPEDLRQLEWISFVRHELPERLNAHRTILREFTGSILDGVDVRETMRNWWRRKIFVREEMRLKGEIGPVVVIYEDEPLISGRYPSCMVWPGESHDEGDLVLYGTMPGEQLVGPGISRCEYGGFLTLPGVHLGWWQDPWSILPRSGWVESKSEVLVLTAALCAVEKFVALISPTPPRRAVLQRAEGLGHPIVHIPSAGFTPATLARLRAFHVLASQAARATARDYIEPRPRGFKA